MAQVETDVKCPKCGGTKSDCVHCSSLTEAAWRGACNCGMTTSGEHITDGMCKAVRVQDVVDASQR